MKLTIVATNKIKASSSEGILIKQYLTQLTWPLQIAEIEETNEKLDCTQINQSLLKDSFIIQLSPNGELLSSENFAKKLQNIFLYNNSKIVFIIGGSQGFSNENKININAKLSFGMFTYPHKLFRVMLIEQIYRASTILLGHPYHK